MGENVSKVILVKCSSYDREEVYEALSRGFELFGDISNYFSKNDSVLLKPNLLAPDPPEKGSTTHPSVFYAVARILKESGYGKIVYGDSPLFGAGLLSARKNGIQRMADELGIEYRDFGKGEELHLKNGIQNQRFVISGEVLKAGSLVNLPKLKTHGLTRITGAMKNIFGVIPGLLKPEMHVKLKDPVLFARMIVDLNTAVKSDLVVMDAIESMEGNGPRNGNIVKTGLLIISNDTVAADAVGARIMGCDPYSIPMLKEAEKAGIGNVSEESIELLGDPIESFKVKKFQLSPETRGSWEFSPIVSFVRNSIIPRPVIDPLKCSKCGICVAACPVKPKALTQEKGKVPVHDYNLCIRCYCCQESCPEGAIDIRIPLAGRLLHGLKSKI